MKILDEKGRLFGAVNLLDLLIVLLVALVIAVAALYFGGGKTESSADVYFTVEIQNVDPKMGEQVTVGDDIYDSTQGEYLGVVHEYSVEPATRIIFDEESGEYVRAEIPDAINLLVTVKGSAGETDSEVTSEGYIVKMGKEMTIKGKGYAGIGYIINLYILNEGVA